MPDAAPHSLRFLCAPELEGHLVKPEPAGRFAPDWFRKMARTMDMPMADGLPGLTVKACLPVSDAFAAGWIIPLSCEITVEFTPEGQVNIWQDPQFPLQQLAAHHPGQIGSPAPPFGHTLPLKWMLPWRVAAPAGVSLLYCHPLNHFELPFQTFSGVVDADRFAAKVNAPFVWTAGAGRVTLKAGTPLVQVIPLARDTLSAPGDVRQGTRDELAEEARHTHDKHTVESVYARRHRVAK